MSDNFYYYSESVGALVSHSGLEDLLNSSGSFGSSLEQTGNSTGRASIRSDGNPSSLHSNFSSNLCTIPPKQEVLDRNR